MKEDKYTHLLIKRPLLYCSLTLGVATSVGTHATAQNKMDNERPNILCLAFEDMSDYLIGCYGNKLVQTPTMDSLAQTGIQFTNAWSTAPQSSPARSSLITGSYATTYGMDIHPVSHNTPSGILFPDLMRQAGYYATNNSKTHYNTTLDNKSCWDESNRLATYNSPKRKEEQPFFAVFNTETSHMGRMRTIHTDGRRNYLDEGIDTSKIVLPPHIPNLPEMVSDFAAHMEAAQDVDKWVKLFVDDLKARGLAENTIIFIYSDHGGCLPRGKGYLYETGLNIPFIAHFPDKWKHLAPSAIGEPNNQLVGFVDFAPTILSLAGADIPQSMQGKAFMGEKKATERKVQFAFASNQLHHYMPVRVATDGRYKYMRNYIPYRLTALRNYYQWGMPSNIAWDEYMYSGKNTNPVWNIPFEMQPSEQLYDLESDPWEINNLSAQPEYATIMARLRADVSENIRQTNDLGFFTPSSREGVNLYQKVRDENYPLLQLYQVAEMAGENDAKNEQQLISFLDSKHPDIQYWAIVGLSLLAREGKLNKVPSKITELLTSDNPHVVAESAYLTFYAGDKQLALQTLLTPKQDKDFPINLSVMECLTKDKSTHKEFFRYRNELETIINNFPSEKNEDIGLISKGILADLHLIQVRDIYDGLYNEGLKLNKGRRISRSSPNPVPEVKRNRK